MLKANAVTYAVAMIGLASTQVLSSEAEKTSVAQQSNTESKVVTGSKPRKKSSSRAEQLSIGFLEFLSHTLVEDEALTDPLDMLDLEDSDMTTEKGKLESIKSPDSSPEKSEEKK